MNNTANFITKISLIFSVIIVVPTAFIYGFQPDSQFDIHLNTIDEFNQFKAMMGLYLGFSVLWILGTLKANFLKIALITNVIFMFGLGSGRLLSIFLDGMPTFGYVFGTVGELVLGTYSLWVLSYRKL